MDRERMVAKLATVIADAVDAEGQYIADIGDFAFRLADKMYGFGSYTVVRDPHAFTVDPKLAEYAAQVAGNFEGNDTFFREDGEEAVILAHVDNGPTYVVSVMLGNEPQVGEVAPFQWNPWRPAVAT